MKKKIKDSKIKSWEEVAKPFREVAGKLKLKESDIDSLIQEARKKRGKYGSKYKRII